MNKLLFLSFLLILPISCFANGKLILQTSDNESIECTQEQQQILMQSQTIKNMLEDFGDEDNSTVHLADISTITFNQTMQCLVLLNEMETLKAKLESLKGEDKNDKESEIKAKDSEIIQTLKSYGEDTLFNVIQATSYLGIPKLLDYSCQVWSDNYELKRFENNTPSFNNQEIIEKFKDINLSSIKYFFIKKYLENHAPDPLTIHYQTLADSASDNSIVQIWNCYKRRHHNELVNSASDSANNQIASASDDGTIRIWDTKTGECLHTFQEHDDWANSASYSSSTQIASTSDDSTIRIWDLEKPVINLKNNNYQQILLHTLCKKTIENNGTLNVANNIHLLDLFYSLSNERQAFLQHITPMKLPLTKQTLLQLYNYKKPIIATQIIGFTSLALYSGYKLLKN